MMNNKTNPRAIVAKDGTIETRKQKAEIHSRMFQFVKSKRKGRRK